MLPFCGSRKKDISQIKKGSALKTWGKTFLSLLNVLIYVGNFAFLGVTGPHN